MNHINYEIKARCSEEKQDRIRKYLKIKNAVFAGIDNQIDTYFKVDKGRLKLRKGNIENSLIYYERKDEKDSKQSKVIVFNNQGNIEDLEKIIKKTNEVLIEVEKTREIYFIDNVKFHLDKVKNLGNFMEIEAKSKGEISLEKIKEQCNYYKNLFVIQNKDLIKNSYSDMLLDLK